MKTRCDVCGMVLDVDKGEAFLTDDGGTYCADHYPDFPQDAWEPKP